MTRETVNCRSIIKMLLWLYLGILTIHSEITSCADEILPRAPAAVRYDALKNQCPFALATPVAAPELPKASFAANWYVSGIGRLGGEDFVSIKSRDLASQFSLYGGETDPKTGVVLVSVKWMEGVGKSTVVLKKGAETAQLEFNEAEVHGAPQPATVANGTPNGRPPMPPAGSAPVGPAGKGPLPSTANRPAAFGSAPGQMVAAPANAPRNAVMNQTAKFHPAPNAPVGVVQPGSRLVVVPRIQPPQ
jgi:hypothetical protein